MSVITERIEFSDSTSIYPTTVGAQSDLLLTEVQFINVNEESKRMMAGDCIMILFDWSESELPDYKPVLDGTNAEATDNTYPMPVDVCSFLGNEDPDFGDHF